MAEEKPITEPTVQNYILGDHWKGVYIEDRELYIREKQHGKDPDKIARFPIDTPDRWKLIHHLLETLDTDRSDLRDLLNNVQVAENILGTIMDALDVRLAESKALTDKLKELRL